MLMSSIVLETISMPYVFIGLKRMRNCKNLKKERINHLLFISISIPIHQFHKAEKEAKARMKAKKIHYIN